MQKEKWIEEVLQNAKEIRPTASNAYLASRIEARLQESIPLNTLSRRWVYASVALLLALLVMNVSMLRHDRHQVSNTSAVQQMIQEYGWGNNDLYSVNLSNSQHE